MPLLIQQVTLQGLLPIIFLGTKDQIQRFKFLVDHLLSVFWDGMSTEGRVDFSNSIWAPAFSSHTAFSNYISNPDENE